MADEEVPAPWYQELRQTLFYSALVVWAAATGGIAISAKNEKDEICANKHICCTNHYDVMFPAGVVFLILMGLYFIISIVRCCDHNKYEFTGTWKKKKYFFHYVEPITMFLSLCVVIAVDVIIFFLPCKDHQPNVPQAVVATFSVFFLAIFVWYGGCYVYARWKDNHQGEAGYDTNLQAVPFFPRTRGMNYFRI